MPHTDEIREEVRRLRRAGLSGQGIAAATGVPLSTVRDWCRGIPAPGWTRRPNAKDEVRERARELRLAGRTYPQIAAELGVSKSSVSLWVRDLPHPTVTPEGLEQRRQAIQANWDEVNRIRDIERQRVKREAASEVGALTDRELMLIGAALYWAEGAKDKPYRRFERLVFINSDPDVIDVHLRWLELMGVAREDRRFRVSIHERADVAGAERFWAERVGVRVEDLNKTNLKKHNPTTARKNTGEHYRGCLTVSVVQSRDRYRRMEGWWYGIVEGAEANQRATSA
ncbi:hypothetical protein BIV57_03795 [Mangrovactinospora gilvigrisea]|uniref:Resolvase n=1 Tax=Mangrovactinospora gilvigrisea TaxID=1428644 RepID=A0A1J7CBH0_9ACTN|nr:hypothetical protein [Mangrovactinospora gilvigrisea]OIV38868.1 hypothetical protein BIV57_03795 [Mangrovactinospora gilvigrisea]